MITFISYDEESYRNGSACTAAVKKRLAEGWNVSQVLEPRAGRYTVVYRRDRVPLDDAALESALTVLPAAPVEIPGESWSHRVLRRVRSLGHLRHVPLHRATR